MRRGALMLGLLLTMGVTRLPALLPLGQTGNTKSGATGGNCWLPTYYQGLKLAFANAAGGDGENLVTVEILPSFQREYALVLKRTPEGLRLLRATFRTQLWHEMGIGAGRARAAQECLDIAKSAVIDTVVVPVPSERITALWNQFRSIDLRVDECPRQKGKCIMIADGTSFRIETADGRSIRLTDVANTGGFHSGNPALWEWVHSAIRLQAAP